MTRGVAHPPELRAEVIAAILAGQTVRQVAARFNLDKALVSRWAASDATVATVRAQANQRTPEQLEALLFDLVADHIQTLRDQLCSTRSVAWLERQSAADLAGLLVAERDTLLRLLAGFRPVDQPALDGPSE